MSEQGKDCYGGQMQHMAEGKMRKYLGLSLIFMFVMFAYSAYVYSKAFSQSIQPSSFRSFGVDGEGKITAIPDVAKFTFGLVSEGGKDISKLQKENTDKMNKAISFVKSEGVADKDVKTMNYNLTPKYQYYDCGVRVYNAETKACPPPEIVGYTINQTIAVTIRDFSKVGDIVSGVVKNGANSVSELSFEIDDPSSVIEKARELAILKAIDKSKKVAKTGDFKVGRLLSIEEGSSSSYLYRNYYGKGGGPSLMAAEAMDASLPAPSLEAGSQEIVVNVILRYEIK